MRVAELWCYPVKSFVGHRLDEVDLSMLGIVSDRRWAVRDESVGAIRGAKKIGELMQFTASPLEGEPIHASIAFPDGTTATTADPDIDRRLSDALGRKVSLVQLPGAENLDHFRRGAADTSDVMAELRSIFGREPDEPLPDFSVFPPEVVEFESPPGTHYDCWPLMVMSTSAFAALSRALPRSCVDARRFRPSIVVDTGKEPGHPEFGWSGSRATLGAAVIEFLAPCPRCVMVTRRIDDSAPEDRDVLRHIVRDLDQNLGVYARIIAPGRVRTGDPLRFDA